METTPLLPNKVYKLISEHKQQDCPTCEGRGYIEEVTSELNETDPASKLE
jgi:hypothetical protein